MSIQDAGRSWLGSDITGLGGLLASLGGPTDAQKQAAAEQQQALQAAQDQLAFDKGVYNANQGTVDSALSAIFGNNPLPSTSLPGDQVGTGTGGPTVSPASGGNPQTASLSQVGSSPFNLQDSAGNGYDSSGNFTGANFSLPSAASSGSSPDVGSTLSALVNGTATYSAKPFSPQYFTPQSQSVNGSQISQTTPRTGLASGYGTAEGTESKAAANLASALNGIKDPQLAGYVGDVQNQANVSPEARAAETGALTSLKGLTTTQETAAEKLQRMLAQRQMENQMKGDREAMASNLKSRGVYGAGDELTKQLLSQQGAASTRALQEAAANANAQQRSLGAISQLGSLGTAVGNQDLNAGSIANQVAQSNQQLKEAHNLNEAKQQAQNNQAASARAATVANAQNNVASGQRADTNNLISTLTNLTGQKTGAANTGAQLTGSATQDLTSGLRNNSAYILANDPSTQKTGIL